MNIIAVENSNGTNVSPAADYIVTAEDIIVVLGDNKALSLVQKL